MDNELQILQQGLIESQIANVTPFDPEKTVMNTVIDLFTSRVQKLKEEDDFNAELKEALRIRMAEATWAEIAQYSISKEQIENSKMSILLAPFVPKDGDRVPLLDNHQLEESSSTKRIREADKDKLHAVETLMQFIDRLNTSRLKSVSADTISNSSNIVTDESPK